MNSKINPCKDVVNLEKQELLLVFDENKNMLNESIERNMKKLKRRKTFYDFIIIY